MRRIVPREKYIGANTVFRELTRALFRQRVRRDWRTYYFNPRRSRKIAP
jgi:hypothetical protein